jgi:hypothetical protein
MCSADSPPAYNPVIRGELVIEDDVEVWQAGVSRPHESPVSLNANDGLSAGLVHHDAVMEVVAVVRQIVAVLIGGTASVNGKILCGAHQTSQ